VEVSWLLGWLDHAGSCMVGVDRGGGCVQRYSRKSNIDISCMIGEYIVCWYGVYCALEDMCRSQVKVIQPPFIGKAHGS